MSKKDRSLANSRDESKKIYYQRKEINRLQQENQQLKEELQKANDTLDTHNELIRYHKSVLDEIRECTRKYCSGIFTDDGEIVFVTPTANIVKILDKVK